MRKYNQYYYSINYLLSQFTKDDFKKVLEELNNEIGKSRVHKQRYYKKDSSQKVNMTLEESLIYCQVFEIGLLNIGVLLTDYQVRTKSQFFNKQKVAKV